MRRGSISRSAKWSQTLAPTPILSFYCIFEVSDKSQALKLEAWIKQRNRQTKEALVSAESELPVPAIRLSNQAIRQMNSAHC